MSLPFKIGTLKKIRYLFALLAGLVLLYFPLKDIYYLYIDPPQKLTAEELLTKGDEFNYVDIEPVQYDLAHAQQDDFWTIIPLKNKSSTPVLFITNDDNIQLHLYEKDTVNCLSALPVPATVMHPDLDNVTNHKIQAMHDRLRAENPGAVLVVVRDKTEWWGIAMLLVAGIALVYSGIKVLRAKYDDRTV